MHKIQAHGYIKHCQMTFHMHSKVHIQMSHTIIVNTQPYKRHKNSKLCYIKIQEYTNISIAP